MTDLRNLLSECADGLEAEADAGWSPAALSHLRKLRAYLNMHGSRIDAALAENTVTQDSNGMVWKEVTDKMPPKIDRAWVAVPAIAEKMEPESNWLMKPALEWLEQAEHGENKQRCQMISDMLRDLWNRQSPQSTGTAPASQWRSVEDVVDARDVRVAYEHMRQCNFPDTAACRVIDLLYRHVTKPALPEGE